MPIVRPISSHDASRIGMRWAQPCLRTACAIPRVSPRSSAIACSARWTPTVPLALVSRTSLSTNSGKSDPSAPAPPVWTQRSLSARRNSSGVMPPSTTSTSGMASRASPCESYSSRLTPSATEVIRSLCSSSSSVFRRMFIVALRSSPSAPSKAVRHIVRPAADSRSIPRECAITPAVLQETVARRRVAECILYPRDRLRNGYREG